ncbi:sigma-54 interaction domain-containing protein [Paenibacillus dauci]|uniref:sigma-54 interaction domain-containing protein n=1 Tax=Paenibacillus dauci TaxID=1567106 RepID=UPI00061992A4|nr:sigma-54-dependent Fis family transcriptional regulator [Paenibacillus dauci]
MFNNEQLQINENITQLPQQAEAQKVVELLLQDQAVCIRYNRKTYLFTSEDLQFWQETAGSVESSLATCEPSPMVNREIIEQADDKWIDQLPDSLSRPIVFTMPDGQAAGYLHGGDLLRQLHHQKRKAEMYLNGLLDTVTDAVTAVDQEGRVICWNDAAAQIYGIPYERIMGQTIGEHFDPESIMLLRVLDEGRKVRNMYHKSSEGTHVLINASPVLDASGHVVGGLSSEQDITHLVKLNRELSHAQASILDTMPRRSDPFTLMDGQSHSISKVVRIGKKIAELNTPALLYGEAGSGKEQLARAIHLAGVHAESPFLSLNCGAVPPGMLDSELFGFIGGTYSGQDIQEAGKLEQTGEGTLFLNEIDKLPPDIQNKLYRAIKTRSFRRYGGQEDIPLHARIIAGTRTALDQRVTDQQFSSELYYALGVVTITVPPLRERREDLSILVHMYLREFAVHYQKPVPRVAPEVMLAFARYDWPGNIAELRAVIERCVILSEGDSLLLEHLPESLQGDQPPAFTREKEDIIVSESSEPLIAHSLKARVTEEEEKLRIEEAIQKAAGNKSIAARILGISRGTLYNKMTKHQL